MSKGSTLSTSARWDLIASFCASISSSHWSAVAVDSW